MSQWFEQSNNANKLRQSYLKGFLDISGGGLYMRSDNSLNFYTTADGVVPAMALDATNINVKGKRYSTDSQTSTIQVSNAKLAFLKDLKENAQVQLDDLFDRTKYIRTDPSGQADTIINVTKHASDVTKNTITVRGHLIPTDANTYDLGSVAKPFNSLYLKSNTIYFDNANTSNPNSSVSFNATTGTLDVSFNNKTGVAIVSYNNMVGIGQVPNNREPVANLDVSGTMRITGDASLNSKLFVGGDVSLNNKLFVSGDVSLNSAMRVGGAVAMNSTLAVTGVATLSDNLLVVKDASLNSKLFVNGDASLNSKLFVNGDVSLNNKLKVSGDTSLNANVDINGDLVIRGNLAVYQQQNTMQINTTINNYEILSTKDISLNGNLVVSKDVSMNSKLFVKGDVSMNATIRVAGDASFNSKLYVANDVSLNSKLSVGHNIELLSTEAGYGFIVQY